MTSDSWEDRNRRQFDALAASYDRLGFLTQVATFVAGQVEARPGQAALDAMTGTGHVARVLAERVGAPGVTGLDLSEGMIEVARRRVPGAAFVVGDAAALPFPDASFDVVVCASGLFFLPDMSGALREWRRVTRPGGAVVFSAFGRGLMGDLPGLWRARLERSGAVPGFPPLGRIPTLDAARALLLEAGLEGVTAQQRDLPYVLPDAQARWSDIEAGLEGQPLAGFTPAQRGQVQAEHMAELTPLFARGPVTVPLPVIVARGVTP